MSIIKLKLPGYALDLMSQKTREQVFDDMKKNGGLPFEEMVTFGYVITPIINSETEAYVIQWHNGLVSVNRYTPGNSFLTLVGITGGYWGKIISKNQALDIFNQHTFGSVS